jgi:hypothetical protein
MRMSRSAAASIFGFMTISLAPSSRDYGEVAANAPISRQLEVRRLIVRDTLGTATCEPKVVFCNYAHLYSGGFSWNDSLKGAKSSTFIAMRADIDGLRVACNGTETMTDEGGTKVLKSQGTGLVAVEFKDDENQRPAYNITVACPSPGDAETPSQPAELGHFDQQTYDQLKTSGGPRIIPGVALIGSSRYENPAADSVNGVTGTVTVTWNLKRK